MRRIACDRKASKNPAPCPVNHFAGNAAGENLRV
jgi:hypothetical protein